MAKDLRNKAIMLGISVLLLVSVLLYLSYAWYTKMTSVSNLEFSTAKWSMNANDHIDNFLVSVYRYPSILGGEQENLAAPGTSGYIPIVLSAKNSDSDASYEISLNKATMSEEFQKRIYFYTSGTDMTSATEFVFTSTPSRAKNDIEGVVKAGTKNTEFIYWHWVYDYDEYLSINDETMFEFVTVLHELEEMNPYNVAVLCSGTNLDLVRANQSLFASGTNLAPYRADGTKALDENYYVALTSTQTDAITAVAATGDELRTVIEEYRVAYDEFDDFDTMVGLDAAFYEPQMCASVFITGEQIIPSQTPTDLAGSGD